MTRRDFVAQLAAATGSALIGCKDSNGPDPVPDPASLDHIIVVTMENRSFDHLLGWLPGADGKQAGLSYEDAGGQSHPTHHLTDFQGCDSARPNHTFSGGRSQYNGGACDGWLRTPSNDLYSIGYYDAADLSFLGRAAPQWLVLDRYFCSFMGPTFPNRIISLAAQTDRLTHSFALCTLPTIWDRLPPGVTGANYGTALVTSSLWGGKYSDLIKPLTSFYSDAAAGRLPNISFVDPELTSDLSNSYHPPGDIRNAESFLADIYKAVTTSPQWKKSLLILTFDEWGGFYDHVPPPVAPTPQAERDIGNTDGLCGFRVPTILVSPFVKRGSVSSKVYDHASVLRLIESQWNIPSLTVRDANANNLMDELDLMTRVTAAPAINVPPGPFGTPCT